MNLKVLYTLIPLVIIFQTAFSQINKVKADFIFQDGQGTLSVMIFNGDETANLDKGNPVTTAKIGISGPGGRADLVAVQPGIYLLFPGTLKVSPGETYTLEIDPEGDGSINVSTSIIVPGLPVLNIQDGTTLSETFDFSWQDSVTGTPSYQPLYSLIINGGAFSCITDTKNTYFATSLDYCGEVGKGPRDKLPEGTYDLIIYAYSGYPGDTVDPNARNMSGDNVTGLFTAMQGIQLQVLVKK